MSEPESDQDRETSPSACSVTAEEYLAHCVYAYAAAPADTPEESVAKALLELACQRLGADPQETVNQVLATVGGKITPPWDAGTGVPRDLLAIASLGAERE